MVTFCTVITLTVGAILLPKRAYNLMVGGRLLTMRSISSPPLVGPRLGLTRDNTGTSSSTSSSIGIAVVCNVLGWPAGPESSLAEGIGANTPIRGPCAGEDGDCSRLEHSPAEVPELLPDTHALEMPSKV